MATTGTIADKRVFRFSAPAPGGVGCQQDQQPRGRREGRGRDQTALGVDEQRRARNASKGELGLSDSDVEQRGGRAGCEPRVRVSRTWGKSAVLKRVLLVLQGSRVLSADLSYTRCLSFNVITRRCTSNVGICCLRDTARSASFRGFVSEECELFERDCRAMKRKQMGPWRYIHVHLNQNSTCSPNLQLLRAKRGTEALAQG